MMMGRENYSLKYVNEGVFKHNLKILKEGQSHCFVCVMDFFLSLFFISFFLSFFRPDATLTKLGANCSPIESVRFLDNLKFDIVSTTMEGIFY